MMRRLVVAVWAAWCVWFGAALGAEAPDEDVQATLTAVAEGKYDVGWDALPASYQKDVETLIHDFGAQVDPEIWNKSFETLGKFAKLLQQKRNLFLDSPLLKYGCGGATAEQIREQYDPLARFLAAVAASELGNHKTIKHFVARPFLKTRRKDLFILRRTILGFTESYIQFSEEDYIAFLMLGELETTLVKVEGDAALLKIAEPYEEPREVKFVRIEGKWVSAAFAERWKKFFADARAVLPAFKTTAEQTALSVGYLRSMDVQFQGLHDAETQVHFNKALKRATDLFEGPVETPTE